MYFYTLNKKYTVFIKTYRPANHLDSIKTQRIAF